jgi:hypothetical protein
MATFDEADAVQGLIDEFFGKGFDFLEDLLSGSHNGKGCLRE